MLDPKDIREDIWGAIILFALLIGGFWLGHGAGLPTGGGELLQVIE